jgi:NDP-sugar pyrophosphorylase family protein
MPEPIHVVVPAAGQGRRFVEAGYPPKQYVPVDGLPMLARVVENVRPAVPHRVTVVVTSPPPPIGGDVEVVHLDRQTSGAVETLLAAGVGPGPLLVANSDQLLGFPVDRLTEESGPDGALATFTASSAAHSYVCRDDAGYVIDIAEKRVISSQAVGGVYYFRRGEEFADAARRVLRADRRVLGEFYVSTVIAEMLERGAALRAVHGDVATLGTPEELAVYEARAVRL